MFEMPSIETVTIEEMIFGAAWSESENGLMTKIWSNGCGRFEIEGSVVRSYEFVGDEIDGKIVFEGNERLVDTFELIRK